MNRYSTTTHSGGEWVASLFVFLFVFLSHVSSPASCLRVYSQGYTRRLVIIKGTNLYLAKRGNADITSSFHMILAIRCVKH